MLTVLKRIFRRAPLLVLILLIWLVLTVLALIGRGRAYREYSTQHGRVPALSLVMRGIHDHVYPWSEAPGRTAADAGGKELAALTFGRNLGRDLSPLTRDGNILVNTLVLPADELEGYPYEYCGSRELFVDFERSFFLNAPDEPAPFLTPPASITPGDAAPTAEDIEREFGVMPLTVIPEGRIEGLESIEEHAKRSFFGRRRRRSKKEYISASTKAKEKQSEL